MLVNAFLFDMSDPDDPKVIMVQKTDQGDKWAFPGGKGLDNEDPEEACYREVSEEVGPKAAEAVKEWIDELIVDRVDKRSGKLLYKQHVFLAPFSGKLRKKGTKEMSENGQPIEKLGPPMWISMKDIKMGVARVGKNFYKIYPSHLNIAHEALSSLADFHPELGPLAKATGRFAWDKG